MKLPAHNQRILTGIGIFLVAAGAAAIGQTGIMVLAGIIALAGQYEFYDMVYKEAQYWPEKCLGLLLGAGMLVCCGFSLPLAAQGFTIGVFVAAALLFLFRFSDGDNAQHLQSSLLMLTGFVYLPLIIQLAYRLESLEILLILVGVITSDTAAYYAGVTLGKKKIWPRVSPKKSWAGSIAGFAACTVSVSLMGYLIWGNNIIAWIITAMTINIAAQLGDFFESALKRIYEVKDSSRLLPGHGGVLDRIDSLLFALPVYVLLRWLWELCGLIPA